MINYGRHYLDSDDIGSVVKTLKSDFITQGPYIKKFENALKKKIRSKYCSVLSNGTAALHLVGLSLGWKPGDIVLTTPISFLSTSNCILYSGATPHFVDIDNLSYTIDVNKLEKKIKYFKSLNKKISAIIATDFAGHPCDWKVLKSISLKYNIYLVNDNCHAIGSSYHGDTGYAAKYADLVTHSYHAVKHITTGEGGAIFTKHASIDRKIKLLRSHGVTREARQMFSNDGPWYYEMQELGYNYRITDFQCSLGLTQLKKLNKFLKKRREIAKIYNNEFIEDDRFVIPKTSKNINHSYHLYPLLIKFKKLKIKKKELFKKMAKKKINLQVHYIPIHLQPFYKKKYNYKLGDFPIAEKFYYQEISLPIYYSLKKLEVSKIAKYLKEYCN